MFFGGRDMDIANIRSNFFFFFWYSLSICTIILFCLREGVFSIPICFICMNCSVILRNWKNKLDRLPYSLSCVFLSCVAFDTFKKTEKLEISIFFPFSNKRDIPFSLNRNTNLLTYVCARFSLFFLYECIENGIYAVIGKIQVKASQAKRPKHACD